MRHIKNGVIVNSEGEEQYYDLSEKATRKVLPMIQKLLSDWQEHKEKGKVTIIFEMLKD
jgi:hypothetical protein